MKWSKWHLATTCATGSGTASGASGAGSVVNPFIFYSSRRYWLGTCYLIIHVAFVP